MKNHPACKELLSLDVKKGVFHILNLAIRLQRLALSFKYFGYKKLSYYIFQNANNKGADQIADVLFNIIITQNSRDFLVV